MQPIENRRNWKGIVVDYNAIIVNPVDTSECCYCLTAPQVQTLLMYAETLRWRTRWINWDGDQQAIDDFAQDLIERLMMSCCDGNPLFPEMSRVVSPPDGNYDLQVSQDGGVTWDTDNTDPRLTYTAQSPLPEDTADLKCQAAWNVRKGYQDIVSALAGVLDATLTLFAIAVAIAGVMLAFLLSPVQPLKFIPVVINLVNFLVGLTETDFTAAFSDSDYEKLQCAAYCSMNDAGQITDLSAFIGRIEDALPFTGIPGNTFKLISYCAGLIFINAMGSTDRGASSFDCSTCACSPCSQANWTWPVSAFGAAPSDFTRHTDTNTITGTAVELAGYWYFGLQANECCTISVTEVTTDTVNFRGIADCEAEGFCDYFAEGECWEIQSLSISGQNTKQWMIRSHGSFSVTFSFDS